MLHISLVRREISTYLKSHCRLPKGLQRAGYKHFFCTDLKAISRDGEPISPDEGKKFLSQEWTIGVRSAPIEVKYGTGKHESTVLVYPALKVERGCGMLHVNHAIAQVTNIDILWNDRYSQNVFVDF